MAEIINLRLAKKARSRQDKEKKAEENRIKFGRTKAEKETARLTKALDEKRLTGHELEKDTPENE